MKRGSAMVRFPVSNNSVLRLHSRLLLTSFLVLLLLCTATLHLLANQNAVFQIYRRDFDEQISNSPTKVVKVQRAKRRLPGCIIIGVRKGGTRALLEYLNIHPNVQKAADEVHFFNNNSNYRQGFEWYRQRMPFTRTHQITVEKTPAYFTTESVAPKIKAMNASIKLLLIVREPVTRLISDYAQLAANKARRIKLLPSFERQVILSDGSVNTDYKAVRSGMYSLYFRDWLEYFPRSQIHVVDGDLMVKQPVQEMKKVETFLGLNHSINSRHFAYNKTKGFYCTVKNGTLAKCLNDSKGRPHPKVSEEVLNKLKLFYEPHNQEFYKMVGRIFNWS